MSNFGSSTKSSVLFMGSFPPRECGIATFTKDLVSAYNLRFRTQSDVVAIDETGSENRSYSSEAVGRLCEWDRSSYRAIADLINSHPADVLNIQFEYGLFGGTNGEWSLDLMDRITKPIVLTLHTVLPTPSSAHCRVATALCSAADVVIIMSKASFSLLTTVYGIRASKVCLIHHGVPDVPFVETTKAKADLGLGQRKVLSTFGLISEGKGIEHAIVAMRDVTRCFPDAVYLIIGQTHPIVRAREGEVYRQSLQSMVDLYGLEGNVYFVDRYISLELLSKYLQATDIYITPYENPAQAVSGTLAYAVGFGKAIVSTPYLYATELLAQHRGVLVPFRDSRKLANAITDLLANPALLGALRQRSYEFGRQMTWRCVAESYGRVFSEMVAV